MPKYVVPINDIGEIGLVKAVRPSELPLNAWSNVKNFRFIDGYAERFFGHQNAFGAPSIAPYYITNIRTATDSFWVYMGLAKAFVYDGSTHTDLTRLVGGDYGATENDGWTSAVLGNVPVFNNFADVPQMWSPPTTAQKLQDLANWNPLWRAKTLRAYKQYLVAGFLNKNGVNYPQMIKWSHAADPNNVPDSWDETDPTKDAGEFTLSDTDDVVVDMAPLRDVNIIYKENTTWLMQYIGGTFIFRFPKLFNTIGALSKHCAQEYFSGRHAVFGDNDIVTHNGQQATSILNRRLRRFVYSRIDSASYEQAFTTVNFEKREVWFCYPETGQIYPNIALVWNFETGAVGVRDLPEVTFITPGSSNEGVGSDVWDPDPEAWDDENTVWDERLFNPASRATYAVSPSKNKIFRLDITSRFDGAGFEAVLEREKIGIPLRAGKPPDFTVKKYMTAIWPRIEAPVGTPVKVFVAGQDSIESAPVYQPVRLFTVGVDTFVDCRVGGRAISIKFVFDTPADIKFHGYELEVRQAGKR